MDMMDEPGLGAAETTPPDRDALILVVEDEPDIADILRAYLERAGMRVVSARDGRRALDLHASLNPDLLLLDVQMPVMDGWRVLSELRHRGDTPVIMLTALDQDIDKLMGLRIGADDYVVKPFNPAEVVARVRAVLRRMGGDGGERARRVLRFGTLRIDLDGHEAMVEDDGGRCLAIDLTLTEFRLLVHLARTPKRVFSRMELLGACLPEGEALERTVDSHLSKLRKKLEAFGVMGVPTNVRGVGYRFGGG
ncbi:response regulator [Rhodospirillum rubrum]|uniref:Two component transcriptional regulator, winged helix family n=1 Tax=Rhodospirillum rubrum (strain ATCC 11170 / ATH 1.1.1 / DSM 467 / LMG 4362 / NCIMB 8255 / S1) TaxID=269796 RepID=Q2RQ69_RHORT|nr:response regulator [Rhodospirillum rubrum]ABC23726.1 two component transcriptional regulator, winged helix family [Rhodospirillum rubrum ATCC 11170]AEO49465.1 two component transcriptional regulator [Rhodospirillum rubrum F11]MBK1665527.1 DNA-binding response regulator [Rhodospirillum rubrum]MBK1677515.1 DNA-binding response regulator [Rhodospirillum rubrum]MBK5955402.1 DNA-binding response regulator [Rhodospirillum rubrum]